MAQTKDLVFEIGTEELPALPLYKATEQMKGLVEAGLKAAHLAFDAVECSSTPRRIATFVRGLATETEPLDQVFRGPAAAAAFDAQGAPTKAAMGFARGKGVDAADLKVREEDGRSYVFAEIHTPARPTAQIVPGILSDAASKVAWPRSQRWGSTPYRFSRPVRWLLCLFGDEVVPVEFCGLVAGRATRGHRLMNPGEYEVADAASYVSTLEAAHVVVDAGERSRVIREGVAAFEAGHGLRADTPKKVYDEVVNLVEWPTVVVADFDEEFLEVPHEIICESMLSNQRYFPLYDACGNLTNRFLLVSNGDPARSEVIARGNERVVRARLSDAKFFYEEDLRRPLESYVERLADVGFQVKLGSMLDKTRRVQALAASIAACFDARTVELAGRAALLAKADLVTGAVVEFTSQQGVMGGYYAAAAGEDPEVCAAIAQHYRPRFAGDELPEGTVGRVVAMADKLDTICGIFAVDEAPTGSSDPFAVRRSAIGVANIVRAEPKINLSRAVDAALDGLASQGIEFDRDGVAKAVRDYFVARLANMAHDEGVSADTVEAVKAVGVLEPVEFFARTHALEDARASSPEVFDDLASAYVRANNLRDDRLGTDVDASLTGAPEAALLAAVDDARVRVASALAEGGEGYPAAIQALAGLRAPIDAFFDQVMVMVDDPALRDNRLRLLNRFVRAFCDVAEIGKMERKA